MKESIVQITKTSTLIMELTKEAINGDRCPLETFVFIKHLEKDIKQSKEILSGYAVDEAVKYGKGVHRIAGADVTVKQAPGRWKFSDKVKAIEQQLKAAKEAEKTAYKNRSNIMLDAETGEEVAKAVFFPGVDILNVKI